MNTQTTGAERHHVIQTIVTVVVLIAAVSIVPGCSSMNSVVKTEIKQQLETARSGETIMISEADLTGLPEPVQRYLRYVGVVGKPHVRFVRLKYAGFFRRSSKQQWTPLTAEQSYTADPPSFVFHARIGSSFLGQATVREKYWDGKGFLLLKIWPGFTVADAQGETTDIDQANRYLSEMTWFPTAYLKPYNQWEAIDEHSAKATLSYQGSTVSAVTYFNERGEMVKFVGQKHIGTDGTLGGHERMLVGWIITLRDYEERHGFRVPTSGEGIFHLSSGDFEYIRITDVSEVEYDAFPGQ